MFRRWLVSALVPGRSVWLFLELATKACAASAADIPGDPPFSCMVLSGKRAKRDADLGSHIKKDDASNNIEVGTRPSSMKENAGNATGVGNVTNNDLTSPPKDGPKDHPCRFCDKIFEKSQALGGHMNKHRAEKEAEGLIKARSLVESKQQILFGSIPWPNYGRSGGSGNHSYGQTLSSNAHIVGTSTTPQSYPANQSASIQHNQIQLNQSVLPQQQIVHGHQGGVNIIRGSHLRSLEDTRTHHGTPSQTDVIVTGQHQAHHGPWVNSGQHPGQMAAYPGQHGGTDFHVQQQLNQSGPSQSLQDIMAQSSNVPMASYMHPFQQEHPTSVQFVELAQINQPVQYYYDHVAHPNQYMYHFHVPQDGSQTSIDEKSESLRNQSVGSDNQTPEHHILLQEGTDHNADPVVGECGAETPNDKVGDAHGLFNEEE